MPELICKIKPYIQPFERNLALQELVTLVGSEPEEVKKDIFGDFESSSFRINAECPIEFLLDNLTYWESIQVDNSVTYLTSQVKREATVNLVRNGITPDKLKELLPFGEDAPLPNRRVLRYGSHGIHEYRGKYFPQLVRSLLNIIGAEKGSLILDTMCGSGTTPVESILKGCNTIGLDFNPLSVMMSQAKCDLLAVEPDIFITETKRLKNDILKAANKERGQREWFNKLPTASNKYLINWFSDVVLNDLDAVISRINRTKKASIRKFFLLCLSNIIRKVSWQKIDDLRVRKEIRLDIDIDVTAEFITELNRSFGLVLSFLYENEGFELGKAIIKSGDAREADVILREYFGSVDGIITSPPYATALPYLDTDRLSIYYLNLFPRNEHRNQDLQMIGNREISNGIKKTLLEEFDARKNELPSVISDTIDLISRLNEGTGAGFRRQNLPALLGKYFLDMKAVFETFLHLLKPGAPAYVVVGNNHTIAGGERVEIETDRYLAQLGESVGLLVHEEIPMEMLTSRDIFKKNTGSAETILSFSKYQ